MCSKSHVLIVINLPPTIVSLTKPNYSSAREIQMFNSAKTNPVCCKPTNSWVGPPLPQPAASYKGLHLLRSLFHWTCPGRCHMVPQGKPRRLWSCWIDKWLIIILVRLDVSIFLGVLYIVYVNSRTGWFCPTKTRIAATEEDWRMVSIKQAWLFYYIVLLKASKTIDGGWKHVWSVLHRK